MKAFLRWWLLLWIIIVGAIITGFCGIYTRIYEVDVTYLCFGIMTLFIYSSFKCGLATFNLGMRILPNIKRLKLIEDSVWGHASLCSQLGFLGTIIGFVMMLSSFATVDITNIQSTQELIRNMSLGLGVALYTTLVGQICNILLLLQNYNLSLSIREYETN